MTAAHEGMDLRLLPRYLRQMNRVLTRRGRRRGRLDLEPEVFRHQDDKLAVRADQLAVFDGQDRLDVQHRAQNSLRLPDQLPPGPFPQPLVVEPRALGRVRP